MTEAVGTTVFLTHALSPARLRLELPTQPRLAHGWTGDPVTSSVTGTSFREVTDTVTLSVQFIDPGPLTLRLSVDPS